MAYWERKPYEAVGPGAHAFDGATRRWNAANLKRYVEALTPSPRTRREAQLPPGGSEAIDDVTAAAETVVLGLWTDRGLPQTAAFEPPLADAFGWALASALLSTGDYDRIVL